MSEHPPSRDYRASDADREAAAERLRLASVEGRIDSEELEQRLAGVYRARTVADLDVLVRDVIPPPPPAPPAAPVVYAPYPPVPAPAPTNGLAVASLVAGVMWIGWLGSVFAVIFGHIALGQIARGHEQGRGLAIAGLAFGYFGLGTLALFAIAAALSA
jgi:uncharacterized protein DUF4190/uncharacterized protein DUF1707